MAKAARSTKSRSTAKTAPRKPTRAEEVAFVRRIHSDPVFFLREVLGVDPWVKQADVIRAVNDHRRVAVKSCHDVGKTWIAAQTALWFLYTRQNSRVITTAPTWQQVRNLLWREIASAHGKARVALGGRVNTTDIQLAEKWFAAGYSTKEMERFQGHHAEDILFIFDEASGVPQFIFDAAEGSMAQAGARMLLIGNPTQTSGAFWDAFKSTLYEKITISAFDCPNVQEKKNIYPYLVTPEWVEERRREWGESSPLWYSKVLGEFPQEGDDSLFHLAWMDRANRNWTEGRATTTQLPIVLGCDIARFGADETVMYLRRGTSARVYKTLRNSDTMNTTGAIAKAHKDTGATSINVDVIGIGAGVYDRLAEQGLPAVAVNVSLPARDSERFANQRAEFFWGLRERFRDDEIELEPDDKSAAQLTGLHFKFDSRGRIQIESKDDIRKRGLPSPDRADALMLAFATPSVGEVTSFTINDLY